MKMLILFHLSTQWRIYYFSLKTQLAMRDYSSLLVVVLNNALSSYLYASK